MAKKDVTKTVRLMREVAVRLDELASSEAESLADKIRVQCADWELCPPAEKPRAQKATHANVKVGVSLRVVPGAPSASFGLVEPLTCCAEATPGRPSFVNVRDQNGNTDLVALVELMVVPQSS